MKATCQTKQPYFWRCLSFQIVSPHPFRSCSHTVKLYFHNAVVCCKQLFNTISKFICLGTIICFLKKNIMVILPHRYSDNRDVRDILSLRFRNHDKGRTLPLTWPLKTSVFSLAKWKYYYLHYISMFNIEWDNVTKPLSTVPGTKAMLNKRELP